MKLCPLGRRGSPNDNDLKVKEKIDELQNYLSLVESVELNTKMLKLALENPDIKKMPGMKNRTSIEFHKHFNKLKALPKRLLDSREYQMIDLDLVKTKENISNLILKLTKG